MLFGAHRLVSTAQAQAAMFEWQEGLRRLETVPPAARAWCERVIDAVQRELRRRLGGPFTVSELAHEYADAQSWFLPIALDVAPRTREAHDAAITMDAAFGRQMRRAIDAGLW